MIRQLLTESVVLSLIGGGLGLLIAYWGVAGIVAWIPSSVPRMEEVAVDGTVLLFTAAVSLLTGLFFGLLPAWRATRASSHEILKAGGRTGTLGLGHRRLRSALAVAEISLALILLVGFFICRSVINPRVYAAVGIDPKVGEQAALRNPRYRDTMHWAGERIVSFLDEVGLVGNPGMSLWRKSFLVR